MTQLHVMCQMSMNILAENNRIAQSVVHRSIDKTIINRVLIVEHKREAS